MAMGGAGMYKSCFMRVIALGAFAVFCLGAAKVEAAKLNSTDFLAACSADSIIAEDPDLEDAKIAPKAYCECVAGKFDKNKLTQQDVDMLTKMHKEEISDADVEGYPTLEDLLNANEGYEDSCRQSFGLPTDTGTDVEEMPIDEDEMQEDDEGPAEDDGSPPE
jgi:hypothetical protein